MPVKKRLQAQRALAKRKADQVAKETAKQQREDELRKCELQALLPYDPEKMADDDGSDIEF